MARLASRALDIEQALFWTLKSQAMMYYADRHGATSGMSCLYYRDRYYCRGLMNDILRFDKHGTGPVAVAMIKVAEFVGYLGLQVLRLMIS